jgi:hypothetical protein
MQTVSVREILDSPHQFDGQAVVVAGLFMYFQENVCLDDTDEEEEDLVRIWLEVTRQTPVVGFLLRMPTFIHVVADGVYQHGACGHLGAYAGQLTGISRIEAIEASNRD